MFVNNSPPCERHAPLTSFLVTYLELQKILIFRQKKIALCFFLPLPPRASHILPFTAALYLHPFTPQVGPLDPVKCKEAASLYWVYGSIRPWVAVECATPSEEVMGSISAVAALSLLVGSVSVQCDRLRQKSWSPRSVSCVAARKNVRRQP